MKEVIFIKLTNIKLYFDKHQSKIFLSLIAIIIIGGFVTLNYTSSLCGLEASNSYGIIKSQLLALLAGVLIFLIIQKVDFTKLQKIYWLWIIISLALTIYPCIFVVSETGVDRWIPIGETVIRSGGISIIFFSLFLASFFADETKNNKLYYKYLVCLLIIIQFFLLICQPDLIIASILLFLSLVVLIIEKEYIGALSVFGIPAAYFTVLFQYGPYRFSAIKSFFNSILLNDSEDVFYQLIQSINAFANGGFLGSENTNIFAHIPDILNGYIFAAVGEKSGLVGVLIFLTLLFMCILFAIKAVKLSNSHFEALLTLSFTIVFILFNWIGIVTAVGLFPPNGEGIPFFSNNGSKVVLGLMWAGLIYRQIRQSKSIKNIINISAKPFIFSALVFSCIILVKILFHILL